MLNKNFLKSLAALSAVAAIISSASADTVSASFPQSSRFPVFAYGQEVSINLTVRRTNADKPDVLKWSIVDYKGRRLRSGSEKVAEGETSLTRTITLTDLPAGYMELHAELAKSGVKLPRSGSRPEGMATFGVTSPLERLPLTNPEQSRFGTQGTNFITSGVWMEGNPYTPLYQTLGVHWVNDSKDWANAEPDRAGQFQERIDSSASPGPDYIAEANLAPLNTVAFLPWWALSVPEGKTMDRKDPHGRQAYAPKDISAYTSYLERLASYLKKQQEKKGPGRESVYYQIGWEPDWHWKGTDEEFVSMYQSAYRAIHQSDPSAVVLGPGYGVTATGVKLLERLLPMGLDSALDGIAIHGYYLPFGNPLAKSSEGKYVSPEEGGVAENIRHLRSLMDKYLKPGAKLFQTEWGLDYRGRYSDLKADLLKVQAAYVTRGHIIFLGEGCDVTYFFYTADYGNLDTPGEDGYGLCFNLTMPEPSFGATKVSPKPVFMSACTLTRVLEGTRTFGPVVLEPGIQAYAFDRSGTTVVALWSKDNQPLSISIPVEKDSFLVDFMGNKRPLHSRDGHATIEAGMYPVYVFGAEFGNLKKITSANHE